MLENEGQVQTLLSKTEGHLMRALSSRRHCVVATACLSLLLPPRVRADGRATATPAADVVLTSTGSLQGNFVDGAGRPLDGAVIRLGRHGQAIATTTTDRHGRFEFVDVQQGVYNIISPGGVRLVRVWSADAAPPGARQSALLVNDSPTIRGQAIGGAGVGEVIVVTTLVTSLVLAGISLAETESLKDDLDALRQPGSP